MNERIRFHTQAAAQHAQQALGLAGISSRLRRDPEPDHRIGCGFALYVADAARAKNVLRKHGLLPKDGDAG